MLAMCWCLKLTGINYMQNPEVQLTKLRSITTQLCRSANRLCTTVTYKAVLYKAGILCLAFVLTAGFSGIEAGQQTSQYLIDFDVLIQPQPTYRINAQRWGKVLQQLGLVVTFRDGRPGERTQIENVPNQDPPTTAIVGIMEPDGRILIRNKKYSINSPQALADLVQQVSTYGAAGPPETSPQWGLTDEQFAFVTQQLSVSVTDQIQLRTAVEAIDSLKLPSVFQVRFADSAREQAFAVADVPADSLASLVGMSKGTAMAIVLAQYGLGFRPLAGNGPGYYIIEIHAGGENDNLWPVGWKTKETLISINPALFRAVEFELEAVELKGLIAVIAERIQLPCFYADYQLQAAGINPEQLAYSRKRDKVTPSRMLTLLGDKFKMGLDVRCDEAGQCFLWVTTAAEYQAFRRRFAHVIPGK